jgi:hypothetical protein
MRQGCDKAKNKIKTVHTEVPVTRNADCFLVLVYKSDKIDNITRMMTPVIAIGGSHSI